MRFSSTGHMAAFGEGRAIMEKTMGSDGKISFLKRVLIDEIVTRKDIQP